MHQLVMILWTHDQTCIVVDTVCQSTDRCGVRIRVLHFRVETRAREMLHTVLGDGWWYGASFGLSLRVVLKIASDKVLGRVLFFSFLFIPEPSPSQEVAG